VITNDQEGNQIVGVKAAAKDFTQFRDVSLKVDGTLIAKLPSNAKILQHNGNLSKGLWGWGSPSVQWAMGNPKGRTKAHAGVHHRVVRGESPPPSPFSQELTPASTPTSALLRLNILRHCAKCSPSL
jgi:hypothetical protein